MSGYVRRHYRRSWAAVALTCLLLPGCLTAPASLSPSTIPVRRGEYTVVGEATGRSWGLTLIGIPLSEPSQIGQARDRAEAAHDADGLVNVSADASTYLLGPFFLHFTTVQGDAIKLID